jgi:hypothetical protein
MINSEHDCQYTYVTDAMRRTSQTEISTQCHSSWSNQATDKGHRGSWLLALLLWYVLNKQIASQHKAVKWRELHRERAASSGHQRNERTSPSVRPRALLSLTNKQQMQSYCGKKQKRGLKEEWQKRRHGEWKKQRQTKEDKCERKDK